MQKTLLLLFVTSLSFAQAPAKPPVIPLEGLDPVALIKGQQLDGDKKFSVTRGRYQYTFANAENKATFEKDPERYGIQMGGVCPRMVMASNPDAYTVYEGKIYSFCTADCMKEFAKSPEKFLESKQPPQTPFPATAAAAAKGKALLARAVEAVGGAAALDSVAAYQESRPKNKETLTFAFPDRFHDERTFSEKFHNVATIVGNSGFVVTDQGVRDIAAEQAAKAMGENRRELLVLLRARNAPGFHTVALDDHTVGVEYEGDRLALVLDAATGRITAMKYHGRSRDFVIGEVSRLYSDFRPTGKLTLPYTVTNAFNGVAEPDPVVISSIVLNPELPATFFARPQ